MTPALPPPLAFGSPPRQVIDLPDFAIARFGVTCAQYLAFIQALALRDPAEAQSRVPRSEPRGGWYWEPDREGRFSLPTRDREGVAWDPRWPVTGVGYDDALAYCAWYGELTHLPIRYDAYVQGSGASLPFRDGAFVDAETRTEWNLSGIATAGPLEGTRLEALPSRSSFWFAYVAAFPEVRVHRP